MDLVEFLTARLDEEQAAAEEALRRTTTTRRMVRGQWMEDTVQPPEWRRSAWPPARVLAEVDAKRRALTRHRQCGTGIGHCDDGGHAWDEEDGPRGCADLADLALPYADDADYDEAWRP